MPTIWQQIIWYFSYSGLIFIASGRKNPYFFYIHTDRNLNFVGDVLSMKTDVNVLSKKADGASFLPPATSSNFFYIVLAKFCVPVSLQATPSVSF